VPERWIINASPIILLAKAEIIHLLPQLCDELIVPTGVVQEVEQGQFADAGRQWLATAGKVYIRPAPSMRPELATWQGGPGEAQVISWGLLDHGTKVVLDDLPARRLAVRLGLGVIGSLGIIVRAKSLGLVPAARPILEKFRGAGAYVSEELINLAIEEAGEGH